MHNKHCLVIGANGFLGKALVTQLRADNQVYGVYHRNTEGLDPAVDNIPEKELATFDKPTDIVFIVGAYIPGKQANAETRQRLFESNVAMVARTCTQFAGKRIVYCSSVSVYKPKAGVITEDDPESAINEYGVSKLWGEKIVAQAENFGIVRFSSIYGKGMSPTTILPAFVDQALNKGEIAVYGDGSRRQNYIHVLDAVGFLVGAAQAEVNGVFLGTSRESLTNTQLAEAIAAQTGCSISFKGEDHSPSFDYDNAYTVRKLQVEPSITLEQGIDELIKWQKKY